MDIKRYVLFLGALFAGMIILYSRSYGEKINGIAYLYVQSVSSSNFGVGNPYDPEPHMIRWLEIDEIYYLMIPNSANINHLKVHFAASDPVFSGAYELTSGTYTSIFANQNGKPLILTSGDHTYQVKVMQSSEIATLFIQTESGHLEDIHASRSHQETAHILFIDDDGKTIIYNGVADRFSGRGNSTWRRPKKPYNIRLTEPTDLLGSGDAKHRHWAILADYMDNSRLRNTISHHLAQELGLEAAVRVRPIDVYINNEYMGLYLLTERVRIDTILPITDLEAATANVNGAPLSAFEHIGDQDFLPNARKYFDIPNNPADITGGYLLEWQLAARFDNSLSGFGTSRGQAVMLRAPVHATQAQIEYISNFIQEMEDAIYSPTGYNGLGRHFTEYIDLESIVYMYVFQEFIKNLDAGTTSFFFYKESDLVDDGLLRAAPPWDFDLSLGNDWFPERYGIDMTDPKSFFVNQGRIRHNPDRTPHILAVLWEHECFRSLSAEVWHETFAPIVKGLLGINDVEMSILESVREYEAVIRDSAKMEWVRWGVETPHAEAVDFVIYFIEGRINFLNEQWGD